MKLTNRTNWNNGDIRKICLAVIEYVGSNSKRHVVYIRKGRSRIHGRASLFGNWIEMRLPNKEPLDVKRFTQIFQHELYHNLGQNHKEMAEWWNYDISYIGDLTISKKTQPKKMDKKLNKYLNAKKRVEELERTIKRKQTALAKWKKREKRYGIICNSSQESPKENI